MTNQKHTILVAGGDLAQRSGQILHMQGHTVRALRRDPPTQAVNGLSWIKADLGQPLKRRLRTSSFSHVLFALAPSQRNPDAYRTTFIDAVRHLAAALDLQALQRFVFISSTAVYGPSEDWVDEATPPRPSGFNGQILLEAEEHVREIMGDRAVILRLSGLYGPGRTRLLERIKLGQVPLTNAPAQWTNRIHIEDAARASTHLLLLDNPDTCYIGTDSRPMTKSEVVDGLSPILGLPGAECEGKITGATGKRLSNARLLASGFALKWPDAIQGYRALIAAN